MQKADKERVVQELTERLRSADSLIVTDYRGMTNGQLASLRTELIKHGAKFTVVKNTLTRRAAQDAGAEGLLAMLEGPTAIAFVESDGNPVAVAKALSDAARETKILVLRGGVLSGQPMSDSEIEILAKLPPLDVLKAQLIGVIVAPLTQLVAVLDAPLQNLVGLLDARITQLGGSADAVPAAEVKVEGSAVEEPAAEAAPEEPTEAAVAEALAQDTGNTAVAEAPAAEGAAGTADAPEAELETTPDESN